MSVVEESKRRAAYAAWTSTSFPTTRLRSVTSLLMGALCVPWDPEQKQLFVSALDVRDGRFTTQRIIQCELLNPEFAYLSACHTTVGDETPDEEIHLASAMQFARFRSVIGTMWAVDDSETNTITSMFYKLMVDKSGRRTIRVQRLHCGRR